MDSEYRYQSHTMAIYVTPVAGGRWEVRSSKDGERTYAYPTRASAIDIARSVARSQWENWGFPCVVYVRERDGDPWWIEWSYGSGEDAAGGDLADE